MMHAFGDTPQPSRFSAILILDHIKCYLQHLLYCLKLAMVKKIKMDERNAEIKAKKSKRKKINSFHKILKEMPTSLTIKHFQLFVFSNWYPLQMRVFTDWKVLEKEVEQTTDNSLQHGLTDMAMEKIKQKKSESNRFGKNDKIDCSSFGKKPNKGYMTCIRHTLDKTSTQDLRKYCIFINKYNIDIGWISRLKEFDERTQRMNNRMYYKFMKCRDANFLTGKYKVSVKFKTWLKTSEKDCIMDNYSNIDFCNPMVYRFLSFLAWDRIGCIIQLAIGMRNYSQSLLERKCCASYLKPMAIATAIAILNQNVKCTPLANSFIDVSLQKMDETAKKILDENIVNHFNVQNNGSADLNLFSTMEINESAGEIQSYNDVKLDANVSVGGCKREYGTFVEANEMFDEKYSGGDLPPEICAFPSPNYKKIKLDGNFPCFK